MQEKKIDIQDGELDQILASLYRPAPDLTERITFACRQKAIKSNTLNWHSLMLKIAAALVVAFFAYFGIIGYYNLRGTDNVNPLSFVNHAKQTQSDVIENYQRLNDIYAQAFGSDNCSNQTKVRKVSLGSSNRLSFNGNSLLHIISPNVKHVWKKCGNVNLPAMAQLHNCHIQKLGNDKDITTYAITGSDMKIQDIVDELYHHGWTLYSSAYPQPGANNSTIFYNIPMVYTIDVIQ